MSLEFVVGDVTILLLATAFALLIAVLALKNEIQTPRNEIRRYEKIIRGLIPEDFRIIMEIVNKIHVSSNLNEGEYELIYGILDKVLDLKDIRKETVPECLEILRDLEDSLSNSRERIKDLGNCYDIRYRLVFYLTVISFFSGIISLFLDIFQKKEIELFLLILPLILAGSLLPNLYKGYNIEKKLIEDSEEYEIYLERIPKLFGGRET